MGKKSYVRHGVWLAVLAMLWTLAGSAAQLVMPGGSGSVISFRDASSQTEFSVMDDVRENMADGGTATAWTQRNSKRASMAETSASVTLDVIWFDGDAGEIYGFTLLNGFFPQNETDTCAIDEVTANTLFGSTDVLGLTITVDGVELTVCGVFRLPGGILSAGADPGYGMALCPASAWTGSETLKITAWEIRVYGSGLGGGTDDARKWLNGAGVSAPQTAFDRNHEGILYGLLAQSTGLLVSLLLCASALICAMNTVFSGSRLYYKLLRLKTTPNIVAYRVLGFCLACAAVLVSAGVACVLLGGFAGLYVPPEFIPTAWSDFGFWKDLIVSFAQSKAKLAQSPAFRPDAMLAAAKNVCKVFSFAALACVYMVRALAKGYEKPSHIAVISAAAIAAPVLGAYISQILGIPPQAAFANAALPFLLCVLPYAIYTMNPPVRAPRLAFHMKSRKKGRKLYENENNRAA